MSDNPAPDVIIIDQYQIVFYHYRAARLFDSRRAGTVCQIWINQQLVSQGTSILKPNEPYNEVIGSGVSLSRAVELFSPEAQHWYFEAYFSHAGSAARQTWANFLSTYNA